MKHGCVDFDHWYRSEYSRVLAAVAVVCGRESTRSEDATNDAFVKAFERWDSVNLMDSPTAWVTKVAINSARRSFRRARHHSELVNSQRLDEVFTDAYPDAELIAALRQLSYRQRRAVVLRYFDDLPQAEVAKELGIAAGTAAATLHQARNRLRSTLDNTEEIDP